MISDNRSAIIPFSLTPGGHSAACLIHRSPILAALEALFEAEWARAVPLWDAVPRPGADVTKAPGGSGHCEQSGPGTKALPAMLTSGLTDAAIARTQGWSPRTTQRRIHGLMSELGASTRFEAAVMAVRRGWL